MKSNIDNLVEEHGSKENLLSWWYELLELWINQMGLDDEQVNDLKRYSELLLEDIRNEMER